MAPPVSAAQRLIFQGAGAGQSAGAIIATQCCLAHSQRGQHQVSHIGCSQSLGLPHCFFFFPCGWEHQIPAFTILHHLDPIMRGLAVSCCPMPSQVFVLVSNMMLEQLPGLAESDSVRMHAAVDCAMHAYSPVAVWQV